MSEQNWDNQIGGNHYRTTEGEQHWDMVVRLFGLEAARGYLVGCATKYMLRAHVKEEGKNELADVAKAIHYMNKWKSILEKESKKEFKTIVIKQKGLEVKYPTSVTLSNGTYLCEDVVYSYQYEQGSNIRTVFKVCSGYFTALLKNFYKPDFTTLEFSCDFCNITLDKNNHIININKLYTYTTTTIKQLEAADIYPANEIEIAAFEKAMKR